MAEGFAPNQGPHYSDGIIWLRTSIQFALKSSAVTITDSPTKIPTSPLDKRKSILIQNNGTVVAYLGASNVSTTNGFPIYPRGVAHMTIEDTVDVFGIVATGTVNFRILEGA